MVTGGRYGGGGTGGEVHGGCGGPQNSSLAGKTSLIRPLLYSQSPKIPVSPARMASNSLSCIGKAPKTQFRRRDWPQIASLI